MTSKTLEIDLGGRGRLDFRTVRPGFQIPGPRPLPILATTSSPCLDIPRPDRVRYISRAVPDLPGSIIRLMRDRLGLLWAVQRFDLEAREEPHDYSLPPSEAVLRYRTSPSTVELT